MFIPVDSWVVLYKLLAAHLSLETCFDKWVLWKAWNSLVDHMLLSIPLFLCVSLVSVIGCVTDRELQCASNTRFPFMRLRLHKPWKVFFQQVQNLFLFFSIIVNNNKIFFVSINLQFYYFKKNYLHSMSID